MANKKYSDPEFEYYQNYLNKANTDSARKQMDFQKMMSDTSHQREVTDLLKAGLNPALSLNNGASSPTGAYASVDSSPVTARSQQKIAKQQIDANIKQTKMSLDNAYKIAQLQAYTNLQASRYASQMSYAGAVYGANSAYKANVYSSDNAYNASVYGSDNAYNASVYGSDTSARNVQNQIDNPTTASGLFREMLIGASNVFSKKTGINNKTFKQATKQAFQGNAGLIKGGINTIKNLVKVSYNTMSNSAKEKRALEKLKKETNRKIEKATLVNNNAKAYLRYLNGYKTINQNIGTTKHLYNNKLKNK